MDNRKEKMQGVGNEKENEKNREFFLQSIDQPVIFVPAETIRAVEKVISSWEAVMQQWDKMIY